MTKPKNFPERKRQRQLGALARLKPMTRGNEEQGKPPRSNNDEFVALHRATAGSRRHERTKKARDGTARFARPA